MKSGKKLIVIIIVLLILLAMVGTAFAYMYVATDVFKSDKELFMKYFMQTVVEDGFVDKGIKSFEDKKQNTAYHNSGEITVDAEYPSEDFSEIIEKVNDLSISYTGKVDSANQKVEQNIEIDYGEDVIFPINYKQNVDEFGIQIDELSKKYIAIKNENLDEFFGEFKNDFVVEIREFIAQIQDIQKQIEFTEEEINQLEDIYGKILIEQLNEANFSSEKTEQNEKYTLELSSEQIRNIIIKILEATKENTLIIDKLNKVIVSQDTEAEKIEINEIDELIDSINEQDVSQFPNLKLTLIQSNKLLNQIIIESGDSKTIISKNVEENKLIYDINSEMLIVPETNELEDEKPENVKITTYFKVQYSGLEDLNNVQENYEIGFSTTLEDEEINYGYKINNKTQFGENIEIDEFEENEALFLNEYNEEQVTSFLGQVVDKILAVNKKQMADLGLEEHENPLLYTTPVIMIVSDLFNNAMESVNNPDLNSYEKMQFNGKFEPFVGKDVVGAQVNALMQTVLTHNQTQGEDGKLVKLTVNGEEKQEYEKVSTSEKFNVEAIYDEDGYVTEIKATANN